jgi:DNA repair exonuclease SbcCD ATPase subunit
MSVPQISLSQFLEAAGPEQAVIVARLWEDHEISYLILFADSKGAQLAVLPVGQNTDYRDLESALSAEIEGLRAQCWTFSLATLWSVWTRDMVGKAEVEEKLKEVAEREKAIQKKEQQVEERLSDLERIAESIEERQKFIEESETKLAMRAQELAELEARIEQTRSEHEGRVRRQAAETKKTAVA